MRKSISLVLVAVMMLSALVIALPTGVSAAVPHKSSNIDYIEALYFKTAPTIDGYISEAEWGAASFSVESYDCATKDDTEPYNRFLYWRTGTRDDFRTWEYTVWLRWNENYFYIGVKNTDPDVHSLKNGTTNTWNGDAFQTRIDSEGPNAATRGQDFTVSGDRTKPWSSAGVPDFLFGYTQIAGGFTEAWENTTNKGMTSFSNNPMGTANVVVAPCGSSYSSDTQNGITTYEVAIPWAYILNATDRENFTTLTYTQFSSGRKGNRQGGIGRELGMSISVLDNGVNPDSQWDAFMAWGSGICSAHQEEGALACTGSNSVELVATEVATTPGYTTYNPASLLDAKFKTDHIDPPNTFYDYLKGDFYRENKVAYDQLAVLDYDEEADLSTWGAPEYQGKISNIGGEHGNVLDYRDASVTQTYIDTRDEENRFLVPPSYTFEYEICYTGTEVFEGCGNYASALYNWFGGDSSVAFRCGYFFNDSAFEIVNDIGADGTNPDILAKVPFDLKKDNWYRYRFQFDNESCNMRFWVDDLSTEADNAGDNKWGRMIFNYRWRYFYYSSDTVAENGTLINFRQMNVQLMYDNIKFYNFASVGDVVVPEESSGGTGNAGPVIQEVTGGDKLSVDSAYKKDGKWYIPVQVKDEYKTAIQISFNIEIDPALASFDSIKGLEADTYTVENTADGKYTITIKDFAAVKALNAGDTYFEIVLNVLDDNASVNDVIKDFADSYRYTVTTGDNMMMIVVAAIAVAVVCCVAVVIIRKRRKIAE